MPVRKIKGSWWVDFRWNGERHRRKSPVDTRRGAQAYEATLRPVVAQGLPIRQAGSDEETFSVFSARWFGTYVMANNKSSEQRSKAFILRLHLEPWFGRMKLSRIKTADIEAFKASKRQQGLSAKSINNYLAVLGKCLRTAIDWDVLQAMPRVRLLRTALPSYDFLTSVESRLLLQDVDEPMWNLMVRVALRTGMRRGELCALDWSDIDLEHGFINVHRRLYRGVIDVPKSNRGRHIPLSADLATHLAQVGHKSGLVFTSVHGRPLSNGTLARGIERICRRTGLRHIGWHALRHTFASQLASEGVPLPAVQQLMGHSSITMTMRYAHLAPSALRGAVDVLERAEQKESPDRLGISGHRSG
jgi:integrase